MLAAGVGVPAGEAAVEPADDLAARAQHLGEKPDVLDAQVDLVHVVLAEPGQRGDPGDRLGTFLGGEPVAPGERPQVLARGVLLGLAQHLGQRPVAVQAVVVGDGRVGRQVEGVGQVVAVVELARDVVEHGRDEDDAVEVHAVARLQVVGQAGGPHGPVRLAGQELRRHPPPVPGRPQPDHLADGLQVAGEAVVRLGLLPFCHSGVAGGDGVDEDEVAHLEQTLLVVHQPVRRRQQRPRVPHDDPAGPEHAQVQPHAGRARPAVERERDRPAQRLGPVQRVRGDEHLGLGPQPLELAVGDHLFAQHHGPGRRGVRLAGGQGVAGGDEVVGKGLLRLFRHSTHYGAISRSGSAKRSLGTVAYQPGRPGSRSYG